MVSTVDILPTIKELAGAGDRGSLDGLSLAGVLLHQQDLDRDAYWQSGESGWLWWPSENALVLTE